MFKDCSAWLSLLAACLVSSVVPTSPAWAQATGADREIPVGIIVVDSQDKAEEILQKLKRGADFASIAKAESIDATAGVGGLMGKLAPSALRSDLRDALVGLAAGGLSHVIRIPTGYAILKVFEDAGSQSAGSAMGAKPLSVSAFGDVRYVTDVDGLQLADAALFNPPK